MLNLTLMSSFFDVIEFFTIHVVNVKKKNSVVTQIHNSSVITVRTFEKPKTTSQLLIIIINQILFLSLGIVALGQHSPIWITPTESFI